ncbi:catalase [Dorcoceras hygrometricum]|uniref:Catalase n=1 Tax=Dorcoceras hygrometricum TaxID=472368 RepID=A0A2Z6ZZX2_9LAMI|nr:catalase [Dorcoceras hygrometricum]
MSASGESSTMMHRLLHASGSHPISTPYDPKMFSELPLLHLCLAPTGVSRTRLLSVDCGSYANPVHDQIRDSFVRLH